MGKFATGFLLLAVLCLSSCVIAFESTPANADQLDRELSEYHADLEVSLARQYEDAGFMKKLGEEGLGQSSFVCTGGRDPAKMEIKAYLRAFREGSCSPLIALAGVMGTKLQVMIDCPTLKSQNPVIFQECGWSTCGFSFFGGKPKSEYAVWIPSIISPVSLLNPTQKAKTCLAHLLSIAWKNVDGEYVETEKEGIRITPMGYTPETRKKSECGFESVSNLLPIANFLSPAKYQMFHPLKNKLVQMGYMIGINAIALPYDWRLSFKHNEVVTKLKDIIITMAESSGKKVTLLAHSMGNTNVLHNLNQMDQPFKDKYIHHFFAIAPPFLGAPKAYYFMLVGNKQFSFGNFGMNFWVFKKAAGLAPSLYDMMPRTNWLTFADQPWMQSIKKRIAVEQNLPFSGSVAPELDIVSKILPPASATCFAMKWKTRSEKCISGLDEFDDFMQIGDEVISLANLEEGLKKHSFEPKAFEFYSADKAVRSQYDNLDNPGVPTTIIYSSLMDTTKKYIFKKSPYEEAIKEDAKFLKADDMVSTIGDGTVLGTSAIAAGFKWAYEFDRKTVPGSKPIRFAEVCGTYNRQAFVGQKGDFNNNEYLGVDCKCTSGSEKGCDHLGVVSDPGVLSFIVNSLQTPTDPALINRSFEDRTAEALRFFRDECSILGH